MLLLIKRHTDTLIEQLKTKPHEKFEFKTNKHWQTFSFNTPINLSEEGIWLLAINFFEAVNSVFTVNIQDISFSITKPSYWSSRGVAETFLKLQNLLELRSENNINLNVEEIRKRGNQIKIGDKEYKLSDPDSHKNEINDVSKNEEYNDLEDMVFRMGLT